MFKTILKYLVTVVVPILITGLGAKYLGTAAAASIGGAVALAGARALHTTPAP